MKKSIIAFICLIFIIGAWLVSRVWITEPELSNDMVIVQVPDDVPENPDTDTGPEPPQEPDKTEEDRISSGQLAAEENEADLIVRRTAVLDESKRLFRGYFYEEAIALLNADHELINHETHALEEEINAGINGLVRFEGNIKHIFFHSLILYPEVLFPDLSIPTGGYNEGFIYQSELIRLLPQLLERGYVLYSINDIFSKDANGVMRQNNIYLPPDKKPLVLSIDDPTYHYGQRFVGGGFDRSRSPGVGFANRVVFDEYGELATEVITPAGETIITHDGDVHVVIDAFVREHPEFSYRGSKGIIAATGYMGIFGYDLPDLQTEEIRQEVIAICDKFKENGWLFASHSYSHNRTGFWGPESNPDNIRWDTRRWREEIEPIVGTTNIFIAPYGFLLRGEGMQVILDNGFDIYCIVDFNQPITVSSTHVVMGRIEIGGFSLVRHADTLNRDFFDVSIVKDQHRPPILSR